MKPTQIKKHAQLVEDIIAQIRKAGLQVSPALVSSIAHVVGGHHEEKPPGEAREVTILLSDIRGFSAMSERFEASQILDMLNRYFSRMNDIIVENNGVIDKYMGDTIMALFGEFGECNNHAHCAINCAVEMQNMMDKINDENRVEGLPELYIGIGINTGVVTTGEMGSHLHNEYTVIGDGVNLATRVGSHSLRGQVLISDYTYQKVKDHVTVGDIDTVRIKGKNELVRLYEITASNWKHKITVPMREIRNSVRVNYDASFPFQVIENGEIQPGIYHAQAKDISYNGIYAILKQPLEVLTEIKLTLSLSLLGDETRDIYGTIKSSRETGDGYGCGIEFSTLDDDSQEAIKDFIQRIVEGG
jgi:adenylate cyclase